MQKPQKEVQLIPNPNNPLMEPHPTPLQPKAPATASAAIPLTRDDTSWPNTVPTSTNLFGARSWLIALNGNETPTTAFVKMEERPNTENALQKKAATPHQKDLSSSAQNNKSLEDKCADGEHNVPAVCSLPQT